MEKIGISVALLTPFHADGAVDHATMAAHASWVMSEGAGSVTLFGTTGEGASISPDERFAAIDALLAAGIPPEKLKLTIYASAAAEAADQVAQARKRGVSEFLLVPPYYFKGCSDDGLYDWHAQLFEQAEPGARFIVYHIPQVTGVPLSPDLVARLHAAFPDRIRAIKDSSGSWDNAEALLKLEGLPVLIGDERLLHRAAKLGGAGSITGMANLYPARLCRLYETAIEDTALSKEITGIVQHPVIPAIKALLFKMTGKPSWNRMRPPLVTLGPEERAEIGA